MMFISFLESRFLPKFVVKAVPLHARSGRTAADAKEPAN
jgi:hypothetical protein